LPLNSLKTLTLFFRECNGTQRAFEFLQQENYTYFDLLLAEIKHPSKAPKNYFMEACKYAEYK
jgi:hypothetical protein